MTYICCHDTYSLFCNYLDGIITTSYFYTWIFEHDINSEILKLSPMSTFSIMSKHS